MLRWIVEASGLLAAGLLPLWFNPFSTTPFEPAKASLFYLISALAVSSAVVLTAPAWAARLRRRRSVPALSPRRWTPHHWLIAGMLVYGLVQLVAALAAADVPASLSDRRDTPGSPVLLWACMLFALALATVLRTPQPTRRLAAALVIGSVAVVLYGFVQAAGLDPLPWITSSVSPVHSTLGRSNFLGAYLAAIVPFTLFLLADSTRRSARLWLVLAAQIVCLLLTLGRGAWLGFTAGVFVFLAWSAVRHSDRRGLMLAGVALIGCLAAFAWISRAGITFPSPAAEAVSQEAVSQIRQDAIDHRFIIWQHTWRLVPARWVLGYGPNTFQQVFGTAYPAGSLYAGTDVVVNHPHNLVLDQLMTAGIVGLSAYVGMVGALVACLVTAWRRSSSRLPLAALASLVALLVSALFNPTVITLEVLYWLVVALALGISLQEEDPNHDRSLIDR